jgi:hypothetical protein
MNNPLSTGFRHALIILTSPFLRVLKSDCVNFVKPMDLFNNLSRLVGGSLNHKLVFTFLPCPLFFFFLGLGLAEGFNSRMAVHIDVIHISHDSPFMAISNTHILFIEIFQKTLGVAAHE